MCACLPDNGGSVATRLYYVVVGSCFRSVQVRFVHLPAWYLVQGTVAFTLRRVVVPFYLYQAHYQYFILANTSSSEYAPVPHSSKPYSKYWIRPSTSQLYANPKVRDASQYLTVRHAQKLGCAPVSYIARCPKYCCTGRSIALLIVYKSNNSNVTT